MKRSIKMKIGVVMVFLIAFFVILNLTNFSKDVRNFFFLISAPIQKVFLSTSDKMADYFEAFFYVQKLQEQNENLKLKIQELKAEKVKLMDLKEENRVLRGALEIGLSREFKMVFAQITGKDITQDSIIINKGLKDGLLENMPVMTQQKILIGKVSQVYNDFSRITLLSHQNSRVAVNIQRENEEELVNIEALAVGKENLQIGLDHIPLDAKIKQGDKVITSALNGFLPSGILIGYVKDIEKLGVELFQRAAIQPAVNLKEIKDVFIIVDF